MPLEKFDGPPTLRFCQLGCLAKKMCHCDPDYSEKSVEID